MTVIRSERGPCLEIRWGPPGWSKTVGNMHSKPNNKYLKYLWWERGYEVFQKMSFKSGKTWGREREFRVDASLTLAEGLDFISQILCKNQTEMTPAYSSSFGRLSLRNFKTKQIWGKSNPGLFPNSSLGLHTHTQKKKKKERKKE